MADHSRQEAKKQSRPLTVEGEDPVRLLEEIGADRMAGVLAVRLTAAEDLRDPNLQVGIAALTAGTDPDSIDRDSPEYRAGIAHALSAVNEYLIERIGH